jgi:hypothetical protein
VSLRIAFVPSPPLLLLGPGPHALQVAMEQALAWLPDPVTVVGAAPADGFVAGAVDATPWGAPGVPAAAPLPLALAVGSHLLGARPHRCHGTTGAAIPLEGPTLVVADGSAARSEKAPRHLDQRAEGFDRAIDDALASGDPTQVLALDAPLAAELHVAGLATWQAVARSVRGPVRAQVLWSGAPYGVHYVVATWEVAVV